MPDAGPDERFLFLSDILPTAWQAVAYADVRQGSTVAVLGLGPVGQFCVRVAKHLGAERVIGVDLVPERLALAARYGAETLDLSTVDDVADALIEAVDGRGPDAAIDAVGMESHGQRGTALAQKLTGLLPDALAQKVTDKFAVDRMDALNAACKGVRRGGTVSVSGVYGGELDPMPLMEMFDRGIQLRLGQAHVRRWTEDIYALLAEESDPLGALDLVTHTLPLTEAARGYELFRNKEAGCIKVVLKP